MSAAGAFSLLLRYYIRFNRLLREERISAGDLWRSVRNDIDFAPDGYLLFDDTVVSKPYAKKIESVRRQWSGSEKRVIEGIGIVTCVYVNPKTQAYWIIDYRIYDVDRDRKTKLQYLLEMLHTAHFVKRLFSDGAHRCRVCLNEGDEGD